MKFKSENAKGILIAFLGALLLTPDTLFMRLSEMDVWTMLFWRGFQMGAILILMTLSVNEYRENFFLIFKKTGALIVLIQASGSVFFTLGIVNSSVALILFCIATGPLFAAFFSLIILKEKLAYFLRSYFHVKSADWEYNNPFELSSWTAKELEKLPEYYIMKQEDTMVESVTKFFPQKTNCDWLNDDELDVYTNTFFENGFQSALNWYRCMTSENQNKELNVFQGKLINNFTLYISGEKDWGMYQKPGALNEMKNLCKNFKGIKIIKNAGHWVQQEKPEDVAKAILNFYSSFA